MIQRGFELRSQLLGPLPIINRFLDRLGVDSLLEQALESDPRSRMPPAKALGVVLRNLIQQRQPLYALGDWVAERDPSVLGLADTSARLNDDCVGRALERLFDADRALLQTEVVVNAIRRFAIDCSEFHNDSTSITFSGDYEGANGQPQRGQTTLKVNHGHNKDHRPDLKQLLWILTVSADGAVPVHYRVADGNTEDTQTHQETWDILRRLAGLSVGTT
jgi:transposase